MQSQNIIVQNNPNYQRINTTINNNNKKRNNTVSPARSNGSAGQACAACKYQRRKCASDCILAPYFPHDHQRQFLNAHRLFGVSNIVKIIRDLEPPARDLAMRTIMFQSDARAVDPVGGCHRIIRDLEQQIAIADAELQIVRHQIALCRASTTSSSFAPHHDDRMMSLLVDDCNYEMKPIFDDDDDDDDQTCGGLQFDSQGNILSSNNSIFNEENATIFKEEDEYFPYNIEDDHNLKPADTFYTFTNCDF